MLTRTTLTRAVVFLSISALLGLVPATRADEEPSFAPEEIAQYRAQLIDLKASFLDVASALGTESYDSVDSSLTVLDTLTDEGVIELMEAGADFSMLVEALDDLRTVVVERRGFDADSPRSPGLPSASYSSICGSDRNDTDAIFLARTVLVVAQGVWSGLCRGFQQTGVVAGFGGNASVACIPVDAVLFAAEVVFDSLLFCDDSIDAAEIEGSYERAEHIHTDLTAVQATVDENQRLIKIFMRRQLEVMRLLITPAGQREISEDVLTCTGDDCPEFPAVQLCPNGSLTWNCRPSSSNESPRMESSTREVNLGPAEVDQRE